MLEIKTNAVQENINVTLCGRLDANTAPDLERTLSEEADGAKALVIDLDQLTYISSAGLRVLLKAAKRKNRTLSIVNASPEVYEIFDMTGFTQLLPVRKKLREFSVEGCEVIGRGAIGTVYRVDEDTIVKVYEQPDSLAMIENEQRRAKQAFLMGIPTAISYDVVKVREKYGSVFELLEASTYNDLLVEHPERLDEITQQYAHLMHEIHAVEMTPGELPEAKAVFLEYLKDLQPILGDALSKRLLELFLALPENWHVIHGDIQMKNVMVSDGQPYLIDMDTLSVGDPVFDLMGIFVTYKAYTEDEPMNSLQFLGLPQTVCDAIWEKTMHHYLEGRSPQAMEEAKKKIQIVAYVRFLHLVCVQGIGIPELRDIRRNHALEHLRELTEQVADLIVS